MTRWRLQFDDKAAKQLFKLGASDRKRVRDYLDNRLLTADEPRKLGHALTGDLNDLWRYRVGDLRILVKIRDDVLVVLVVQIGNRRDIYR